MKLILLSKAQIDAVNAIEALHEGRSYELHQVQALLVLRQAFKHPGDKLYLVRTRDMEKALAGLLDWAGGWDAVHIKRSKTELTIRVRKPGRGKSSESWWEAYRMLIGAIDVQLDPCRRDAFQVVKAEPLPAAEA